MAAVREASQNAQELEENRYLYTKLNSCRNQRHRALKTELTVRW